MPLMEQQHRMHPAVFATADMLVLDDLTTATTVASKVSPAQAVHRSPRPTRPGSRSASPAHPNLGPFGHPAVEHQSPRSVTIASPSRKCPRSAASKEAKEAAPNGQVRGSNGTSHLAHHSTSYMDANGHRSSVGGQGWSPPPPELWGGQMNAQAVSERGSEWWRRLDERVGHLEAHMKAENERLHARVSDLEATVQAMTNEMPGDERHLRADSKFKIDEARFAVRTVKQNDRSGSPTLRSDSPNIVESGSTAKDADAHKTRNGTINPYKLSSTFKVKNLDFADEDEPIMIQTEIRRTPSNVSSAVSTGIPTGKKKRGTKGRDKNSFLRTHSINDSGSEESEETSRHGSNAPSGPRRGNALDNRVGVPGIYVHAGPKIIVDEDVNYQYVSVSENAYGAFIHLSFAQGVRIAILKLSLMVLVSAAVQVIFSIELFFSLPPVYKSGHIVCSLPSNIQTAAVFVFITLMLNNAPEMLRACRVTMTASFMKVVEGDDEDDAEKIPIKLSMCKRGIVFLFACMTEIVAWCWLLVTGITFIMTANNVEMVMRSTVSIVFVMQVDELLYGVCCSKKLKEDMEKTTYMIWSKVPGSKDQRASDKMVDRFFFYCHLPFLIITAHVIVYGIRGLESISMAEKCQSAFWSGVGTAFDQWSWAYDGSNAYVPEHTHEGKEIRRYLQRGRT